MEWFQYYFPGLRSPEPVDPWKSKVTEILAFFAFEDDGTYPHTEACVMFLTACVLLVFPTLKRICTKRFLRKLGLLVFVSCSLTVLAAVLVMPSAIQANDLFLFMSTKCLRFLQEINHQWKPAVAVLVMVLVNIACACIVKDGARIVEDGAVKTRTFVSGLMKEKLFVKPNACRNLRVLNTDVKVTRSGTIYG